MIKITTIILLLLLLGCSAINQTAKEPSCTDSIINLDETDVDCGGNCSACPTGKHCLSDSDCKEENCKEGVCSIDLVCDIELLMKEKEIREITFSENKYNFAVVDVEQGAVITINNNPSPRLKRYETFEGDSYNLTIKDIKSVNDDNYVSICFLVKFDKRIEDTIEKVEQTCLIGDANNDKVVNRTDYDLIFQISKGMGTIENDICCIDLNQDGKVNKVDMGFILQTMQGQRELQECIY